jgi:hypothetical protein
MLYSPWHCPLVHLHSDQKKQNSKRNEDSKRRDLLEVIEDRYQAGATIIASQCPVKDWHPNIGDPTLADAVCDRLLHNAYKIEMRGDSMRTKRPVIKTDRKEAIESDGKLS